MSQDIIPLLFLACCFLALFGCSEFLYHKMNVSPELTRKLVHIITGLLTLLFPIFLQNHWQVLLLCGSFLIILLVSLRFGLLPSIHAIARVSYGSILYPVAVYGCYLAYFHAQNGMIMFYLPVLVLALCDPVAALTGKRFPYFPYNIASGRKTLVGSLAFFLTSAILTLVALYLHVPQPTDSGHLIFLSVLISVIATGSEAIGSWGSDNITIPASVALSLHFFL